MGQLCLNGQWRSGIVTWTRAASLEGSSPQAERLMALYEEGNLQAQGGDIPKALAIFQRGLSGFLAIDQPDPHDRVAEAALLWGLGTAADRAEAGSEGWQTLLRIMSPGAERHSLPLGLAINWSHSATLAGYRHDRYVEVCAILDALQRLGWGDELGAQDQEAMSAVKERYTMLSPFRARCFEGLMQESRFQEADQVAQRALETYSEIGDQAALSYWTSLQQAAVRQEPGFRLQELEAEFEDSQPGAAMPAIRVLWDGNGRLEWRLGQAPEDPNDSALARLFAEASQTADAGDLAKAVTLYDRGLTAWDDLKHPRSSDAVVRAMMIWGKATCQDRLSKDGSPDAWETLLKLAEPGKGNALPLPLMLRWTQSAVIVATGLGRFAETQSLLVFLMEMALHPRLGRKDPALSQELMNRFISLLEGVYGGFDGDAQAAAEWALELQSKVEPAGLILLPLRDLLYHALSAAERHSLAEGIAVEVLAWARQEGEPETVAEWQSRVSASHSSN